MGRPKKTEAGATGSIRALLKELTGEIEKLLDAQAMFLAALGGAGEVQEAQEKPRDGRPRKNQRTPPAAAASGRVTRRDAKPCCGSLGTKHKSGCGGKLPAGSSGGPTKYKCIDCSEVTTSDKDLEEMKADGCPGCGKHSMVQK